jgi:hypothetical protein
MNINNKDLLGLIILIAFAGLAFAGSASYFWKAWFKPEKLRQEAKKRIQKQSWQSSAFKKWQLEFIHGKTWLWYGRIVISFVTFLFSSFLIIGLIGLVSWFTGIAIGK